MKTVLFEPWGLGDALIASWAGNLLAKEGVSISVVCAPSYEEILKATYPALHFQGVALQYTGKEKGTFLRILREQRPITGDAETVFSIRGDIRDFFCCRRLFPGARIKMSGWEGFLARRSKLADLPFQLGLLPVRNRYERWANLIGNSETSGKPGFPKKPKNGPLSIAIHQGAQWISKRYPYAEELGMALKRAGHSVVLVHGPGDANVSSGSILLEGPELTRFLKDKVDLLICNDSSPMHLGFALKIPTAAIFGNTGVSEWLPPGVYPLSSARFSGYRPRYPYAVDSLIESPERWLAPETVLGSLSRDGWL